MRLGSIFEEEGHNRCALEQFVMVADLSDGYAQGPLCAARLCHRLGLLDEASDLARRALAIEPGLKEAVGYVAR